MIVSKTALAEVPADLGGDVRRQVRPGVVHRQHDALDLEVAG